MYEHTERGWALPRVPVEALQNCGISDLGGWFTHTYHYFSVVPNGDLAYETGSTIPRAIPLLCQCYIVSATRVLSLCISANDPSLAIAITPAWEHGWRAIFHQPNSAGIGTVLGRQEGGIAGGQSGGHASLTFSPPPLLLLQNRLGVKDDFISWLSWPHGISSGKVRKILEVDEEVVWMKWKKGRTSGREGLSRHYAQR